MKNNRDVTGGKPIVLLSQSISVVSNVNSVLVFVFYNIHERKGEVLFLFFPKHNTKPPGYLKIKLLNI
jgi:hypothetical protein